VDDPVRQGRWAGSAPSWGTAARVVEKMGAASYALSLGRRTRALKVSGKVSGAKPDEALEPAD
jgi:hypothetical protein